MKLRHTAIPVVALSAALALAGCSHGQNAQQREQAQQQQDLSSLEASQPLPHFNYSQERQALIIAETAAANGTQTTSFFFNQGVQDPVSSCPSIGMGVPDSASLSNPQEIAPVSSRYGGGTQVISQEDPDGVYVPESSSGTWVNCVDRLGREYLVRWEGFVYTATGPAVWNKSTGSVSLTGAPTMKIATRQPRS